MQVPWSKSLISTQAAKPGQSRRKKAPRSWRPPSATRSPRLPPNAAAAVPARRAMSMSAKNGWPSPARQPARKKTCWILLIRCNPTRGCVAKSRSRRSSTGSPSPRRTGRAEARSRPDCAFVYLPLCGRLRIAMIQVMETKLRINLILFELEFNITRILNELRVLLKFNLLFLPAIAACYAATGYVVWNQLSANAEQEVMETARLMLETARAMRTYTTTQVAPLLDQEQAKVARSIQNMEQALDVQMPAVLNKAMPPGHPTAQEQKVWQTARQQLANSVHPRNNDASQPQFFPQSIPFYAATEAFNYFREKFPDFSYKEAALNPTNP